MSELGLLISIMIASIIVGMGCLWLFRHWLGERERIMQKYLQD